MQGLDPGLLGAGAGRAIPQCCDIMPRLGEAACGGLSGRGASSAWSQQDVLSPLTGDRQSRLAEHNATVAGPYWGQCDHQVGHVFECGLESGGLTGKATGNMGMPRPLPVASPARSLGAGHPRVQRQVGGSALGRVGMVTPCTFLAPGGEVGREGLWGAFGALGSVW